MAYEENTASKIFSTKLTANDSTAQEPLGTVRELADGRKFRYVKMTDGALALGQLTIPADTVTVTNATSADGTGPDGATTTIITDADATWTNDAYIGYYFEVATNMTGSTEPIKVVGNTATTLTLEKQISTALASGGTDDGQIIAPKSVVQISPVTTPDGVCSGAGIGTITEDYYGWVQTSGYACLIGDTITEGVAVSKGGNAEGEALEVGAANDMTIGVCVATSGTSEYFLAELNID